MAAQSPKLVYLEAHVPHTSAGFLIPCLILFAGLTVGAWLTLWPVAILFALVTLYLLRFTLQQAKGSSLAIEVTDRAIYYRGWLPGLFGPGLPKGEIPLDAIGSVELVKLGPPAAPAVAIWLSNPQAWLGRGPRRWASELTGVGDLAIYCDETDRTAEQVHAAIGSALAALSPGGERTGEKAT